MDTLGQRDVRETEELDHEVEVEVEEAIEEYYGGWGIGGVEERMWNEGGEKRKGGRMWSKRRMGKAGEGERKGRG